MGDALTGSLQKQWAMEQRQREQIIQLSHKLKTPLTIIEGNAELLAEDALTPEQREQVQAILGGVEQTRTSFMTGIPSERTDGFKSPHITILTLE